MTALERAIRERDEYRRHWLSMQEAWQATEAEMIRLERAVRREQAKVAPLPLFGDES